MLLKMLNLAMIRAVMLKSFLGKEYIQKGILLELSHINNFTIF